jgi:hypothetical protein
VPPLRRAIALSTVLFAAGAAVLIPAAAASAAPPCVTNCVVTVAAGPQSSWTVPANASDVSVVVAAGSGGESADLQPVGGAGGQVSVDLGTKYDGETLYSLVGAEGAGGGGPQPSGGGGSYVATTSGFVAIAGGGGGGGESMASAFPPIQGSPTGGAGGFSSTTSNGGNGANDGGFDAAGTGAVGATPGQTQDSPVVETTGAAGGAASVASDGTITPGVGGYPGTTPAGGGGGGFAGGGSGDQQAPPLTDPGVDEAGPGGGGSGFLAAGLTASATAPHTGDGSITFTYSLAPTISTPASDVTIGSAFSATIGSLPASTAFTVLLSGSTTPVASGTTDANGDPVTIAITVPAGTSLGSHTLSLEVGRAVVATTATFTVVATATTSLPTTGLDEPWWAAPGAALLVLSGALAVAYGRRRSRSTTT